MTKPAWAIRSLSRVAQRAKGKGFTIDPAVPLGALIRLAVLRALMLARGIARFRRLRAAPFIGRGVELHQRAKIVIGRSVTIADGCVIDALSTGGVVLGDRTTVGYGTRIECTGSIRHLGKGITTGTDVGLGTNNYFGCAGGVVIGAHTIIGNFTSFHSEEHITERRDVPIQSQGVSHRGIVVGDDCWIGAKVTVLDGVRLGRGSIVAAGAVLTAGTYDEYGVYGGVPARRIGVR